MDELWVRRVWCGVCSGLSTRLATTRRSQPTCHSLRSWTWRRSCQTHDTTARQRTSWRRTRCCRCRVKTS